MFTALLPVFLYLAVLIVAAVLIQSFFRRFKLDIRLTGQGKEIHFHSPIASLDLEPHSQVGPELSLIPIYPGATPLVPGVAEYDAHLHALNRDFHQVTANYWTPAPKQIVVDFYRSKLSGWTESAVDNSFTLKTGECIRKVAISSAQSKTFIQTGVAPNTSAAGAS